MLIIYISFAIFSIDKELVYVKIVIKQVLSKIKRKEFTKLSKSKGDLL
jgi:hypothetical protein